MDFEETPFGTKIIELPEAVHALAEGGEVMNRTIEANTASENLRSRVRDLEVERDNLRARHAALVEDILKQIQGMEKMRGSQLDMIQDQLKSALAEVKG